MQEEALDSYLQGIPMTYWKQQEACLVTIHKASESTAIATQGSGELPLPGFVVIASVPDIEVPAKYLRSHLAPLGWEHTLQSLEPRTAVQLTIKAWLRDLAMGGEHTVLTHGEGRTRKTKKLIREISPPGSPIGIFVLIVENLNREGLDISYLVRLQFLFERKAGTLRLQLADDQGKLSDPADITLQQRLDIHWNRYYHQELQPSSVLHRMVRDVLTIMQAINMRSEGGGVYFVPATHVQQLNMLKRLLEVTLPSLVNNATASDSLFCFTPLGDAATKRDMAKVAHRALLAELTAYQTKLNEIIARAKTSRGNVRKAKMAKRVEDYDRLHEKIQYYAELLGMETKDLEIAWLVMRGQASALL